jgi:hypothetical protein
VTKSKAKRRNFDIETTVEHREQIEPFTESFGTNKFGRSKHLANDILPTHTKVIEKRKQILPKQMFGK